MKTILCVVDNSEELKIAIRYAALLADRTGENLALLYPLPRVEFQHLASVENLMREERQQTATETLEHWANVALSIIGKKPILYTREGSAQDALLSLLAEDSSINRLVLAAADHPDHPGELVNSLGGRLAHRLNVPCTVIPGHLSETAINELFA